MKKLEYSSKYKSIFNKLSARYQIPPDEIEEYVDEFFMRFKYYITHPTMPEIQISNLGTFKPSLDKIYKSLKARIYWYKRGSSTREKIVENILYLWEVRGRLIERKLKQTTWTKWNRKRRDYEKKDKRSLMEKIGVKE